MNLTTKINNVLWGLDNAYNETLNNILDYSYYIFSSDEHKIKHNKNLILNTINELNIESKISDEDREIMLSGLSEYKSNPYVNGLLVQQGITLGVNNCFYFIASDLLLSGKPVAAGLITAFAGGIVRELYVLARTLVAWSDQDKDIERPIFGWLSILPTYGGSLAYVPDILLSKSKYFKDKDKDNGEGIRFDLDNIIIYKIINSKRWLKHIPGHKKLSENLLKVDYKD